MNKRAPTVTVSAVRGGRMTKRACWLTRDIVCKPEWFSRKRSPGIPAGFTMLELMFGVAIAAVLAVIAISQFSKALDKSKVGSAVADISIIQAEIERYRSANGNQLPDTLPSVRLDPWQQPYFYTKLEGVNGHGSARKDHALNPLNRDYDLFSAGKDGVFKSQISQKDSLDDIVRARNGAYVGLAEDF
ncbi:MAG: prepilin-type N-terminal cleavage/methylation domain-containing protein [Pseudoxanthomonas sp.]